MAFAGKFRQEDHVAGGLCRRRGWPSRNLRTPSSSSESGVFGTTYARSAWPNSVIDSDHGRLDHLVVTGDQVFDLGGVHFSPPEMIISSSRPSM